MYCQCQVYNIAVSCCVGIKCYVFFGETIVTSVAKRLSDYLPFSLKKGTVKVIAWLHDKLTAVRHDYIAEHRVRELIVNISDNMRGAGDEGVVHLYFPFLIIPYRV